MRCCIALPVGWASESRSGCAVSQRTARQTRGEAAHRYGVDVVCGGHGFPGDGPPRVQLSNKCKTFSTVTLTTHGFSQLFHQLFDSLSMHVQVLWAQGDSLLLSIDAARSAGRPANAGPRLTLTNTRTNNRLCLDINTECLGGVYEEQWVMVVGLSGRGDEVRINSARRKGMKPHAAAEEAAEVAAAVAAASEVAAVAGSGQAAGAGASGSGSGAGGLAGGAKGAAVAGEGG